MGKDPQILTYRAVTRKTDSSTSEGGSAPGRGALGTTRGLQLAGKWENDFPTFGSCHIMS